MVRIGIIFGLILIGDYSVPGAGLSMIWAAAFVAFVGGIVMIVQAIRSHRRERFRVRSSNCRTLPFTSISPWRSLGRRQ